MTKTDKVTTLTHPYITMYLTLEFQSTMCLSPQTLLCYLSHLHQQWQRIYQQNTVTISGGGDDDGGLDGDFT